MKKYIMTSLLVLVPSVVMAADRCTNPDEYTIDRRCYVTDEQKRKNPYSSVVKVVNEDRLGHRTVNCTGTIVKEKGDYYLYTTDNCVKYIAATHGDGTWSELRRDALFIDTPAGRLYVYKEDVGSRIAIYKIRYTSSEAGWLYANAVEKTDKTNNPAPNPNLDYPGYSGVRVIGYGSLKIMSDDEIHDYKKAYEESFDKKLDYSGRNVANLNLESAGLTNLIESDVKLKESVCDYYVRYGAHGCQGWEGNEGSPIFDEKGRIMAVVEGGPRLIAGDEDNHASFGNGRNSSSSLLKLEDAQK